MNDQLLNTMLSNTYSLQTMHHRLALLKEFLETTLYTEKGHRSVEENLDAFFSEYEDDEAVEAMKEWGSDFFASFTVENMYERISAINEHVQTLPSIIVYVPVIFHQEQLQAIGDWFRSCVSAHMMLDTRVDPSMVGGCGFVWNGRYYDYSFSYFLNKHHDELTAYLDSYEPEY